jgi:hypothetical protein
LVRQYGRRALAAAPARRRRRRMLLARPARDVVVVLDIMGLGLLCAFWRA